MIAYLKVIILALFMLASPAFAQETSNKQGLKAGAETLVNGAALLGMSGVTSGANKSQEDLARSNQNRTWENLGAMHRARPGVAEFGK